MGHVRYRQEIILVVKVLVFWLIWVLSQRWHRLLSVYWHYVNISTEQKKKKKKKQHNDGEQKNVFLKKLKEIISFHSYYDTERDNIKNAIRQLCDSKQNYNKELQEANNNNATIDNKQVKDNNGINKA